MTITLGEMIRQLEVCDQNSTISFDFGGLQPTTFSSWRGVYSELAVGWDSGYGTKVSEILERCKKAVGSEYMGWKGGEYVMSESTPVWVDNPGKYSCTGISEIDGSSYEVVIKTYRDH